MENLSPAGDYDERDTQIALRLQKALDEDALEFPTTAEDADRLILAMAEMDTEQATPAIVNLKNALVSWRHS